MSIAHRAAQGVDLADDLPLGHAADRRVAAHLADRVAVDRQQRGAQAHPRGGQRGFQPGVAGPDDHHIEIDKDRAFTASSSFDPAIRAVRRSPFRSTRSAVTGTCPIRATWPLADSPSAVATLITSIELYPIVSIPFRSHEVRQPWPRRAKAK